MCYYIFMKSLKKEKTPITEEKPKKKKKKKETLFNVILVILAGVFLFSSYKLASTFYQSYQAKKTNSEIHEIKGDDDPKPVVENDEGYLLEEYKYNNEGILVEYASVYEQNNDMFGWLKMEGTRIDYPVVLTDSNDFYLHRNFYKKYSYNGTLFIDYTYKPSYNICIVYGHNMNDGSMFHDLLYYKNKSFYNEHPTFTFDNVYDEGTYEVISAFYSRIYEASEQNVFKFYNYYNLSREKDYNYFVSQCKKAALYKTESTAEYGEPLVMFITCSNKTTGRFVVVAKKIY